MKFLLATPENKTSSTVTIINSHLAVYVLHPNTVYTNVSVHITLFNDIIHCVAWVLMWSFVLVLQALTFGSPCTAALVVHLRLAFS